MPPYSDNLYSTLDFESDVEPIDETQTQHEDYGLGVPAPGQHAWMDTNTGSGGAVDAEDPHLFSPTDGYFGTSMGASSGPVVPASSNVPHVPNVFVEDPSLQRSTAEGKAREAEQESRRNGPDLSSSDDGYMYTATSPSRTTPASRNGSSSAYTLPAAQRSLGPSSQSGGATYYTPSSSSHIPSAATPSSYTTYSTQPSACRGQQFPFIPREAPPAYTPSPTSPSNPQGFGDSATNYRTFSQATDTTVDMGRLEETQGLLAHQPESMRDHTSDGHDEASPTWRGRMRRARQQVSWRSCKMVLISLLLLSATAGFLSSLVSGARGKTGRHNPAGNNPQTEPGQPKMSYPEIDGDFAWDDALFCKDAQIHHHAQTFAVDFGANKQLIVMEETSHEDGRRGWGEVQVQGSVNLRRAGSDTPDSVVTVEVATTDERLAVYSSWDAEAGALQLIVPHRVEWSRDRPRQCVNVKVTVWVPEHSELQRLHADVVHLDIKLLDNLSLSVADGGTMLISTVGAITAASTGAGSASDDQLLDAGGSGAPPDSFRFHSRIIDVKTTAAPIKGIWPLYDYLGLQSTAGNIKVAITPQDPDPAAPKPAILYVKTLSGDVDVREPIHSAASEATTFRIAHALHPSSTTPPGGDEDEDRYRYRYQAETVLPPRDYRVDVHTTSGDIRGAVAFSSAAGFRSTSGAVRVELLPVLDASEFSGKGRGVSLDTASTSGRTDVTVLEPLWVVGFEGVLRGAAAAGTTSGGGGKARYTTTAAVAALRDGGEDDDGGGDTFLRCLYSTHTTTSANIRLRYPGSWEGDVSLSSLTGGLKAGGEGVKVIKAGSDWPGVKKTLLARKGEKGEGGNVVGKSTSGDVDFWVGGGG
ncbi:hypothetical protein C8A00DRAFT_14938 [Chaetomidium leptoderma]|uniref:Uncharacterized protein n=1 Tax=Chaetomidium leptoderma TaxID=669021 RepID=A0AAN6ZYS6_9PEZI|nr:hypothetical protein C8A00DRAFT_14938 [Chaetomidium leptoderma]